MRVQFGITNANQIFAYAVDKNGVRVWQQEVTTGVLLACYLHLRQGGIAVLDDEQTGNKVELKFEVVGRETSFDPNSHVN